MTAVLYVWFATLLILSEWVELLVDSEWTSRAYLVRIDPIFLGTLIISSIEMITYFRVLIWHLLINRIIRLIMHMRISGALNIT